MSFSDDLNKFTVNTNGRLKKTVRSVVFKLGETLVFRSPVGDIKYWLSLGWYQLALTKSGKQKKYKTLKSQRSAPAGYVGGHFRANWQYSFGSPMSGEVDSVSKQASLDSIKKVKSSPAFGVHYIVNNTPYSIRLENGWSRQAPNGVLKLTVMNFNNFLRESASEARNK